MKLITERLTITDIKVEDAKFYLDLFNDPDWITFINDKNLRTLKDTEAYIKKVVFKKFQKNGLGFFTVFNTKTKEPIGTCSLLKRKNTKFIDIGYGFLPQGRGKGFATEATIALMDYAQHTFKIDTIYALTKPINFSSIKLVESIGFKFLEQRAIFGKEKDNLYKYEY